MKQKEYVILQCQSAINAGIPILYLRTDDICIVDDILRSQRIVPFWYLDENKKWTRKNDPEAPLPPDNIYVCNGQIKFDFGAWTSDGSTKYGIKTTTFGRSSFIPDDVNFKYIKDQEGVRGGIPQLIAVRNYHRSNDVLAQSSDAILERLVAYHSVLSDNDGIKKCYVILQSSIVDIPQGLEPYVEVIDVPPLSDEEIAEMIVEFAQNNGETPYKACLDQLTLGLRGFSAHAIKELLKRIQLECGCIFSPQTEKQGANIISNAKQQMLKKEGLLKEIDLGDKEAAGLDKVKTWIKERRNLINRPLEAKRQWALNSPKGILVNGIPGTGKSLLAKEVARQLGVPLYQFDMGSMLGKHNGESEQNMRRALALAKALSPCVLWVDEVEKAFSSASASGDSDGGLGIRLFGNFLTWMQEKDYPCFVFATANDSSKIPPEFRRRGRFDMKFYTFMPTKEECKSIFRSVMAGKSGQFCDKFSPEVFTDGFLDEIMAYCGRNGKFMTGADIEGIVADAKFYCYAAQHSDETQELQNPVYKKEVFKRHLIEAIDNVRTYGETDMPLILKTLFRLAEDKFSPSSSTDIFDIKKVNCHTLDLPEYAGHANGYDELLYKAIKDECDKRKKEKRT